MTRHSSRLVIALAVGALAVGATLTFIPSPTRAQDRLAPDGTWRSDGYGYVLTVHRDSLRAYEVTAVSCLPSFRAHRTDSRGPGAAFVLDDQPFTFVLLPGATPDQRRLHDDAAASEIVLRRIATLPAACAQQMGTDPLTTFDVFWETFREHYPFFAAKHVDWDSVRATSRPRAAGAAPEQLFALLRQMIEPLHDAHTYLAAPDPTERFHGFRPDPDPIGDEGRARVAEIITTRYLRTPLRSWANGRVAFGMLRDSIGYLRVTGFGGYVPHADHAAWLGALDAALDTIFVDTRGWRGLVIDVRLNGGGADPLGLAIAARLTTTPYIAYSKVARADPTDPSKMTPPQPSLIRPSPRPGWHGPIVELTSRYSVSAAETFTQALMGRRPAIERVGESTQGVFSDVLGRRLPTGWRFGLPNELFLTAQGTSFDGPGIPPTIPVPTFTRGDLEAGRDPSLERAIALLTRHP